MPIDSYFVWITQATTDLMTTHSDVFLTLGMNLFRGLVAILIAWTGVSVALGAASGGAPRMDRFAGLIMCIAFTYAMLVYYSTPLPGIGVSFHRLITDQGANLAGQIEAAQLEEIFNQAVGSLRESGTTERTRTARRHASDSLLRHCCVAVAGAGSCISRHRLWVRCGSSLRSCWAYFHSVLCRAPHGVDVLGLVQSAPAVCVSIRSSEMRLYTYTANSCCTSLMRTGRRLAQATSPACSCKSF